MSMKDRIKWFIKLRNLITLLWEKETVMDWRKISEKESVYSLINHKWIRLVARYQKPTCNYSFFILLVKWRNYYYCKSPSGRLDSICYVIMFFFLFLVQVIVVGCWYSESKEAFIPITIHFKIVEEVFRFVLNFTSTYDNRKFII